MRRISMAARDELVAAITGRYAQRDRAERGRILDEFSAVTGFHRKQAMRLLRVGEVKRRSGARPGRRVYDEAVREALIVVWEASDRICGKRLRPLLPILVEAMERHGHLQLEQEVRTKLLAMSAATIDRALRDIRRQAGTAMRRRSAPSAAIRRSVPVRTFDGWDGCVVAVPVRLSQVCFCHAVLVLRYPHASEVRGVDPAAPYPDPGDGDPQPNAQPRWKRRH
jgi:hypothetical protein